MAKKKQQAKALPGASAGSPMPEPPTFETSESPEAFVAALAQWRDDVAAWQADHDAEVATQAAAAAEAGMVGPVEEYPITLYRAVPVDAKHPNGYEARQAGTADERARFDPKVWKESPADLAA